MSNPNLKKGLILLTLGLMVVSAFFIRLRNFDNTPKRSIDEAVYYHLSEKFYSNPRDYNINDYAQDLLARGKENLPDYFFKPLYKYPPLLAMMSVPTDARAWSSTLMPTP